MTEFYQHIYRTGNGYSIIHQGTHYGYYTYLPDALYDRDRFIEADWDIQTWTELPETENIYEDMDLPSYDKSAEYITYIPEKWVVQKRIDGEVKYFGRYDSLEEAVWRRDELIRNNWSI